MTLEEERHDELIDLLKKHYRENILGYGQEFEHAKKRKRELEKNPKEVVKEAFRLLSKDFEAFEAAGGNFEVFEVGESNFEKKWGFRAPPAIFIKISTVAARHVLEEFMGSGLFEQYTLEKSSLLNGMDFAIFSDDTASRNSEHEALHALCNHVSKSAKEIHNLSKMYGLLKENKKEYGEEYLRILCLNTEMYLLDEISAYRSNLGQKLSERAKFLLQIANGYKHDISGSEWNYENVATYLKSYYVEYLSNFPIEKISESGMLPNCGAVSSSKAAAVVEREMKKYLETKVDDGIKAMKTLRTGLPESEVTRIMLSIGDSESRISPIDELVLWSKHYKEILAGV